MTYQYDRYMKLISVYVSRKAHEQFQRHARRKDRAVAELIREAMELYGSTRIKAHTELRRMPANTTVKLKRVGSREEVQEELPGYEMEVETVTISKFKASCQVLLEKVRRTGRPILVTRRGEPVAQVIAVATTARTESWLGSFKDTGQIVADIVSPVVELDEWDVHKP